MYKLRHRCLTFQCRLFLEYLEFIKQKLVLIEAFKSNQKNEDIHKMVYHFDWTNLNQQTEEVKSLTILKFNQGAMNLGKVSTRNLLHRKSTSNFLKFSTLKPFSNPSKDKSCI